MPKNIEMSVLGSDGTYDVLYPKNISDIVLSSEYLKGVFNLSDNSDIDDAFDYINRKIILLQYNKAGINVTLKSAGGSPLEGIPINGITANYDGTGSCVTDSEGKCFGYCDAGNVTVSTNKYVDMTVNSQQLNVLASEMYNTELTASNFINFKKWTSTTNNIRFSNNVSRVDVSVGGGGGGCGNSVSWQGMGGDGAASGGAGGGGYSIQQESVLFNIDTNYTAVVGGGGTFASSYNPGGKGGSSSFLNIVAEGGNGGNSTNQDHIAGAGGVGNGNGGSGVYNGRNGNNGGSGTTYIYTSFTEQSLYGGGGGSGGAAYNGYTVSGGAGGSPGGGKGGNASGSTNAARSYYGDSGINGLGGGAGGGGIGSGEEGTYWVGTKNVGGSGCVAIRIHLKVTA